MVHDAVDMYDAAKHPEIKSAVAFEPAKIAAEKEGGAFNIAFGAESRARSLRLVIGDYETDAPAIQKISLQDKEGKVILPTKEDITSLRKNQILEIVPGDRIGIAYED